VRVLLLITGLALLKWIGRALLWLLGHRHPATLTLGPASFELRGERRFMGLSLGKTHLVVPFRTVEAVHLSGSSPRWALAIGVVCVMAAAAVATTLVIWGISGRELSWVLLGLLILAAGVLLDGVAYLLVRRAARRREHARLEILAVRDRLRLDRVPPRDAEDLLEAVGEKARTKWNL
jgi:hypothetical protein